PLRFSGAGRQHLAVNESGTLPPAGRAGRLNVPCGRGGPGSATLGRGRGGGGGGNLPGGSPPLLPSPRGGEGGKTAGRHALPRRATGTAGGPVARTPRATYTLPGGPGRTSRRPGGP